MSTKRNPERVAVRIARKLVSEIRRQRLRPAMPLVAEHRMVEALGVARATVCEALRFLELQRGAPHQGRARRGAGLDDLILHPRRDRRRPVVGDEAMFATSYPDVMELP